MFPSYVMLASLVVSYLLGWTPRRPQQCRQWWSSVCLLHRHFSALTIFLAFNDVCGDCKHPIKLCIWIQIQELHSTRRSVLRKAEMQRVNRLWRCLCFSILSSRTRQSKSSLSCGQVLEIFSSNNVLVLAAFMEQVRCQDKAKVIVPLSQSATLPSIT